VISRESRLRLLWMLFDSGELPVWKLTQGLEMSQPNTSLQLRDLRAAGFVRFRREKMNVIYRAEADRRVGCANELLNVLRKCYDQSVPFDEITRQATAFTHERRIEIVQALNGGALSYNQLLERSRMNSSALSRHLRKLEARGVIGRTNDDQYRITKPDGRLGKVLLRIARSC